MIHRADKIDTQVLDRLYSMIERSWAPQSTDSCARQIGFPMGGDNFRLQSCAREDLNLHVFRH